MTRNAHESRELFDCLDKTLPAPERDALEELSDKQLHREDQIRALCKAITRLGETPSAKFGVPPLGG